MKFFHGNTRPTYLKNKAVVKVGAHVVKLKTGGHSMCSIVMEFITFIVTTIGSHNKVYCVHMPTTLLVQLNACQRHYRYYCV